MNKGKTVSSDEGASARRRQNRFARQDEMGFNETKDNRASRNSVYLFALLVFSVAFGIVFLLTLPWLSLITVAASGAVGLLALSSVRVAQQWEKVVVLRFGRFNRLAGPGIYLVIPFVESSTMHVDQRITATPFSAEEALTADLVPTDVDAVMFWMVHDAEAACTQLENYPKVVAWSAQTTLRDVIGRINLADVAVRRNQMDEELRDILNDKCTDWGVTVISVEIRDILIPKELQDVMSKEAQATQESNARLVLAEMEKQISELLVDSAKVYREDDVAFQLRMAAIVSESLKESNSSTVVVPSAFSEGFNAGSSDVMRKIMGS